MISRLLLSVVFAGFLLGVTPALAQTPKAPSTSLTMGIAIPLSGNFAKFGVDVQRGMILAQEELATRSTRIELIFEDTQYLPRLAATAAQKLIETDKVDVLVSLWDTAEAVAPLAERAKVPHFSLRWNPRVAEEFSHTFTFESTYFTWVKELVRFLKSENVREVSLMTDMSGAAWVMARDAFLQEAQREKIQIVTDAQIQGAEDDPKPALTKILRRPGDYIVMLHYDPTLSDVMRRLKNLPVKTPITGFFEGMEEAENFDGRKFVSQFDTQPWFLDRFGRRYPEEKPIKAAFGYDLVMILGKLVEKLGRRPNAPEILAHLNTLKDYEGATGKISANASRNIETTCVRKEFIAGKARTIPVSGP